MTVIKNNKVALVTGTSRGIGYSISKKLFELGYYVIGTSTKGQMEDSMHVDEMLAVDFNDIESTQLFMNKVQRLKKIDILVNNVGINIIKKQETITVEDYSKIENINLRMPFFLSAAVASIMAETGGGRIVNIASIWSVVTKENRTLYSTMKSGLHGLTRSMAVEWATRNILINTISPGFVNTDLTKQSLSETEIAALVQKIPLNRLAETYEIAELVVFLTSDSNTYLTGQNIVIDGGFSIV